MATLSRVSDRVRALAVLLVVIGAVLLCGGPLSPRVPPAGAAAPESGEGPDPVGVWPLTPQPAVLAGFDRPDSAWGAGHRGVDLHGRLGQPVRSALPGRVGFTGVIAGRGVVTVAHGGTRTTYEPVRATVAVGNRVGAGEVIGMLTAAGSHCFPRSCLHWGWLRGENYLDPLRLVGGVAPVRLLPLWRAAPVGFAPDRQRPPPAITDTIVRAAQAVTRAAAG